MYTHNSDVSEADQEISLYDIARILYKHRKFILIFITSFMIICGIYLFFLPPSYEAQGNMLFSMKDNNYQTLSDNTIKNLVDSYDTAPIYTIDSVIEQIQLRPVLETVIETLGSDSAGTITYGKLAGNLSVTSKDKMSLIAISIKDENPLFAQKIVNTMIDTSIAFYNNLQQQKIDSQIKLLTEAVEQEQIIYESVLTALNTFSLTDYSLEQMKSDYSQLTALQRSYKSSIEQERLNETYTQILIETATELLSQTPSTTLILQRFDESMAGYAILKNSYDVPDEVLINMQYENFIPNQVYEDLQKRNNSYLLSMAGTIKKRDYYTAKLTELQDEISQLLSMIQVAEQAFEKLSNQVATSKQIISAYEETLIEASVVKIAIKTDNLLSIAHYAVLPDINVSNWKMLLAISLLLSLFLCVLIVFILESYQNMKSEHLFRKFPLLDKADKFKRDIVY